ncbi:TAFII28-domain-containing protein [Nadsonia fulvescens var. elongata DSM 6958]|uniref:Transcription initiation factor TFIID subunit 11 n=1 Tax=Nadsonia fulvescens var. elongata DSM 6958 TaxID=857566 RepID=A0A1E3PQR1_9ASCO|nr:TAFII28-domain-containing protein [Nadsonia fulvescens var. elongata DSM 6958]
MIIEPTDEELDAQLKAEEEEDQRRGISGKSGSRGGNVDFDDDNGDGFNGGFGSIDSLMGAAGVNFFGDEVGSIISQEQKSGGDKENDGSSTNQVSVGTDGNHEEEKKEKLTPENDEHERIKLLLQYFDSEQMNRYEIFRRANINRTSVKKLANAVLNQSITGNVAVVLSGLSKVFVGEIVEKARDVQMRMDSPSTPNKDENRQKPLRPEHLREAWRLFKEETGTVPQAHWRRQSGDGDGRMFR